MGNIHKEKWSSLCLQNSFKSKPDPRAVLSLYFLLLLKFVGVLLSGYSSQKFEFIDVFSKPLIRKCVFILFYIWQC